jgi:hypothetical protein
MMIDDLITRLDALTVGRQAVLDRITTAAHHAGAGAVLLIGSLGQGGGDAFSDLDLIVVPGAAYTGMDLDALFGDRVLAGLDVPRNAPIGGGYRGLCLDVAGTVLWLDAYTWPPDSAAIPADATAVFDIIGLAHSDLEFIPLITAHADPYAAAHPDNGATRLLRVAVAAKYLARGDLDRIVDKLPDAAGLTLDAVPALLHDLLTLVDDRDLTAAVAATAVLVDLATTANQARATAVATNTSTGRD